MIENDTAVPINSSSTVAVLTNPLGFHSLQSLRRLLIQSPGSDVLTGKENSQQGAANLVAQLIGAQRGNSYIIGN